MSIPCQSIASLITQQTIGSFIKQSLQHTRLQEKNTLKLPFFNTSVPCGFTSPAEDFEESSLSLDKALIQNPNSTFLVRASGNSMEGAGIFEHDLLVIDRSYTPQLNDVVLAVFHNEFTVKHWCKNSQNQYVLRATNPLYPDIICEHDEHFCIWGVVTYVIHGFRQT